MTGLVGCSELRFGANKLNQKWHLRYMLLVHVDMQIEDSLAIDGKIGDKAEVETTLGIGTEIEGFLCNQCFFSIRRFHRQFEYVPPRRISSFECEE